MKDDYIEPSQATHLRVYTDDYYDHIYVIDAADDNDGYTELIWEYWNGEPMTKERAIASARAFAIELGRPELASTIRIRDPKGKWVNYSRWHRLKATLCRFFPSRSGAEL